MKVKLPKKISVKSSSDGDITLLRQSRKYHIPDEELITMTPDEALGLGMLLIKSAQENIFVSHPDQIQG